MRVNAMMYVIFCKALVAGYFPNRKSKHVRKGDGVAKGQPSELPVLWLLSVCSAPQGEKNNATPDCVS
jgi:hypothetical protein